jgi:carbon monoxide dehydrogenase subunit G
MLLGCLFSFQSVIAGEVLESYVGSEGDHFLVHIDMLIDANPEQVRKLLTDYTHLDRLSPSITGSKLLYSNKPHYRVQVTTDGCVFFYCRQLVQVQDVTELKNGFILVKVLPEMSDFAYSQNLWRIQAQDGRTRVTYSSDLVPGFWVPPIVGTAIFQHKLLEESHQVVENLERLANSPHDSAKQ